ncbi:MAG: hypothetical protein F6K41_15645 [Symploca sp. SIO3E6]|nr:hypothetical protein [Caldora sp. SIO3E6]
MTQLLKQAFAEASKLSEQAQDTIAKMLLAELASDKYSCENYTSTSANS